MKLARTAPLALGLALALSALPSMAQTYSPPANDAQAVELFKMSRDKKSSYQTPGQKHRTGQAEIFVNAPVSAVRAAVLDYGNYSKIIPRFDRSKVLKRDGLAADVYLQVPLLHGAAKIWSVQHFAAPVADGKGEKITSTFMQGNVNDMRTKWSYRAVDATHSIVVAEIYADPKIDVPGGGLTREVENACGEAVISVKDRAEATAKKVATN